MMHFGVLTILPEMFETLRHGVTGRAFRTGIARLDCFNPRDWTNTPRRQVDDKPYGGGPGMVLCYEPVALAISHARTVMPAGCRTVYLSPQGRQIRQHDLNQLAREQQPLLFLAGRYEGIDERIITRFVDEEWSLGDFVLSGGEIAAMAFVDALVRLLPGCLGHQGSASADSFMEGLLDYPHYTRPETVDGMSVPSVLLGGNHRDIERWRRMQALGNTWLKRPDILERFPPDEEDAKLLQAFMSDTEDRLNEE